MARLERGNHLVTTGHVPATGATSADQVTVKPVLDLPTRDPVEHLESRPVRPQTFRPT